LVYVLTAVYPVLVFCSLVVLKIPLRYFSIFVVCVAAAAFIGATSRKKDPLRICGAGLLAALGLACFLSNAPVFLKLYPVLMNAVMLGAFGSTLFAPPPMIFRFATLADKTIRGSLAEKRIERYCRTVTAVWCAFFVVNGGIAAWTVASGSDALWSVYNGGISYILIGGLFAGEFIVRKIMDRTMPKAIPLSQCAPASRPADHVLCYERSWGDGRYKTWNDFLEDTARLRLAIQADGAEQWILHADDCWYFLCAFTALLQCGREIRLTANISPAYIAEIRAGGGIAFLTDQPLGEEAAAGRTLFVPALLAGPPPDKAVTRNPPPIAAGETAILMYTSGTTGKPKVVRQRLTEFENDNRFVLSQWGEEWLSRKVCATVSQHHIYGLLFGILLPFTAGVPFRRRRIETPEELETAGGTPVMIITVPAFLKRAVESKAADGGGAGGADYGLTDPWIYTSGGVLERDVAEKTSRVLGFWPVEVYGSTETSGIAWRQSRGGLEWTPFDNAQVALNSEGRLVIRSPYIKDPAGFTTGDLAELLPDGRFLLNGRADSIVKIEEKRVSLPEVEARLLQSGLAADVCVIALAEKRQYLAAALVLNDAGQERFRGAEKHAINRHFREYLARFFEPVVLPRRWRYVQSLPLDAQGKKKKAAIEALFAKDIIAARLLSPERLVEQSETTAVVEFAVPPESDYFNEHFPELKVLPAVAQFELAVRFAGRYLGTAPMAERSRRLKFSSLVRPGVPLRLELSKAAGSPLVNFTFSSPGGETVYSSGSFAAGGGEHGN
jgi:acyl-coenzyme A synthetase/AMP-(fatty) acid ligase/uncharacterized membrane protein/3-hydroxymyristoyl/3-hydroxydecanoyl-(acyl carrier protein) dehydratase